MTRRPPTLFMVNPESAGVNVGRPQTRKGATLVEGHAPSWPESPGIRSTGRDGARPSLAGRDGAVPAQSTAAASPAKLTRGSWL